MRILVYMLLGFLVLGLVGMFMLRAGPLGLAQPKLSSGTPVGEDLVVAQPVPTLRLGCTLPQPGPNVAVHAISVLRGGKETPVQSHYTETGQIDVFVTDQSAPVLLLLAAHDAVIWTVRVDPKARLAGIVASGYDDQVIVGPSNSVPATSLVFGTRQCYATLSQYFLNIMSRADQEDLDSLSRLAFKRPLTSFQSERTGEAFWIGPQAKRPKSYLDQLPVIVPADFVDDHRPILFGRPALERLVKENVIRPARQEDLDAWRAVGAQKSGPRNDQASLDLTRTYVINRFFQLPLGLSGDASTAFILPAGVSPPKGFVGENLVLTFHPYGCHWFEGFSDNCIGIPAPRFQAPTGN
jgi:hypothetical protein